MELNAGKCVVLSFKRSSNIILIDYLLDNAPLRRVVKFKDLGVFHSSSLSPYDPYIQHIVSRANSLLGFIFRSTKHFVSPYSMVILYKALVRPILEYGSIIWSPYQLNHVHSLNNVQKRFVRMLGCRLGWNYFGTPIAEIENQFALRPLDSRRQITNLVTLYKLVNGLVDCPVLLSSVDLSV
ncbi:uncharacterized protein LOC124366806 [Homalodisca vitripennis]|uniref:uncharacterized protein LOC124366806 n=1 Tax=Homalodisca vitripennis TaxID=197043 RepID=UPI001EEAE782|nr:uncharacterized protein LOC124366806 [Homalodisca vitripennis]